MTVSPERRNGMSVFGEIGVAGIARHGGYLDDDILPELRGRQRTQAIRQMLSNDATIGALLFAVKMLVRQVTWRVDPAADANADAEVAEFVRGALFDDMSMSWPDTLSDVLSFLPWGWSWHELVYKRREGDSRDPTRRSRFTDGQIGWRKWPIRSQETLYEWVFDEAGGVQAMKQQPPPDYTVRTIPIEKALLFRTEPNRGSPEGASILRNAYRAWRMKTRIENLEGIGIERDLAGLPVAYLPPNFMSPNATAEEKATYQAVKDLVTGIRRDEQEGVVMPMAYDQNGNKLFDLQLLSSGGSRQFNTNETINRYDARILMSVMADFMMLGMEKVGSNALSTDKTDLFGVALGAWLDSIAGVVNQHAIPRLLRLNGMPLEAAPVLAHDDIKAPDLDALADYVATLVNAGVLTPTPDLEEHLRDVGNLPAIPEGMVLTYDREDPAPKTPPEDEEDDESAS